MRRNEGFAGRIFSHISHIRLIGIFPVEAPTFRNQRKLFIKALRVLHSPMISLRLIFAMLVASALSSRADEGMWLFNNPPLKQLKEKYQFEPTPQWLEHLQKSSVRFNSGGSGSFVSANGLVHYQSSRRARHAAEKSQREKQLLARMDFTPRRKRKKSNATDLELNVLMSIEDVTAQVNAAVKTGMTPEQAGKARENAIAQIEKESKDKTGLRSDVVTLYQGGLIIFTVSNVTTMSASFSRQNNRSLFMAAIPIISSIRASISISAFSALMKTGSRRKSSIS